MFKSERAQGDLKPDRVYEIQNILGELVIRDVGPSAIQMVPPAESKMYGMSWYNDINYILECSGGRHILTIDEITKMR